MDATARKHMRNGVAYTDITLVVTPTCAVYALYKAACLPALANTEAELFCTCRVRLQQILLMNCRAPLPRVEV